MNVKEICVRESCNTYHRLFHTPSETAARLYYYPQWAGVFVCRPDFYIHRHSFASILLLQTKQGQGRLLYKGEEYVLDQEHIALIDCREEHIYFPVSKEPWAFHFLHFSGERSEEMYAHIYESAGTCIFLNEEKMHQVVEQCMRLCGEERESREAQLSQCIANLIYDILLQAQQGEKDQIAAVCRYIAQNYDQPLTTEQLARTACFSRCYFATSFKKHTGMTPHEYVICRRLDRAKELLCGGNMTVERIAESVGFGDAGTFIRAFKRKEKITPLQYRKLHFSIRSEIRQ